MAPPDHQPSSHSPRALRRALLATTSAVLLVSLIGWGATALPGESVARAPEKVWVCKFVGKPGVDERLKEGKNPIEVSRSTAGAVGEVFADAQGRSYVIAVVDDDVPAPTCPATPPGPPGPPESPGPCPEGSETPEATETPTPTEPPETTEPTESAEPTETAAPTETTDPTETEDPTETGSVDPTESVAPDETGAAPDGTQAPPGGAEDENETAPDPDSSPTGDCGGTAPTGSEAGLLQAPATSSAVAGAALEIPVLRVRAPLAEATVADGVLHPPADPAVVGVWRDGAAPGEPDGTVVVAGHSVRDGYGAFDEIGTLRPGAEIVVHAKRGKWVTYRVSEVRLLDDGEFAAASAELFQATTDGGSLVLITCADWDGVQYRSNVVVTAERGPVSPRRAPW